jgi:Nucleotide modification associated domain 3
LKIIFSRKGFDSASGGVPSPIFEDGTMLSLPIPYNDGIPFNQINSPIEGFRRVSEIVEQLAQLGEQPAHLDPDLDADAIFRREGWRGILGQSSGAQTHLDNNLVRPGDLFLFFGLFRRVKPNASGRLRFVTKEPRKHVFFGWLRVATRYALPDKKFPSAGLAALPDWAKYHPHVKHPELERAPNAIYTATCNLHSDLESCKLHRGAERCTSNLRKDTPGWGTLNG